MLMNFLLFQRFFKYLCIAAKVKTAVDIAKHSLQNGKVIILMLLKKGFLYLLLPGLCPFEVYDSACAHNYDPDIQRLDMNKAVTKIFNTANYSYIILQYLPPFNFQCVIFGLQSTGEARTLDQLDDMGGELNDFISTTK